MALSLFISHALYAQSSTVNPGTSPSNSTTTTTDVATDNRAPDTASANVNGDKTIKQTLIEKKNNVKRAIKKGAHQIQEMACQKDDVKCQQLAKKHRAQEAAEYHNDKLTEAENLIQTTTETDTTP